MFLAVACRLVVKRGSGKVMTISRSALAAVDERVETAASAERLIQEDSAAYNES